MSVVNGRMTGEKAEKGNENKANHPSSEDPSGFGTLSNKANLKVIERAPGSVAKDGGAQEEVRRNWLGLHRSEVAAPKLSLVLFINLFHASSDPHSRQRGGVAFLPLLIPLHHTTCTYLNRVSSGAAKVTEPQADI